MSKGFQCDRCGEFSETSRPEKYKNSIMCENASFSNLRNRTVYLCPVCSEELNDLLEIYFGEGNANELAKILTGGEIDG